MDHLLFHAMWNTIFTSVVQTWVLTSATPVVDLSSWRAQGGRFQLDAVWKMIPSCPMWCLWREIYD
jgi:hypothetical protein